MKKGYLFLIAALFLSFILIAGCVETVEEEEVPEEVAIEDADPEEIVLQFFDAIRDLDLEKAETLIARDYLDQFEDEFDELARALEEDSAEADLIREMFKIIFENFDLTIAGHTIDGNEATVYTVSTHPDPEILTEKLMERLFAMMFSEEVDLENLTEEEGMRLMLDVFSEVYREIDTITTEAEVPMIREDGHWKVAGEVISDYTIDFDM